MRHRGPETADGVQGADSDADEVLVPDDEGDSARFVGKVWNQDAVGFQHLRDAGSSFHFPMGGMGSAIMVEQLSRALAQHCPHCPANERQPNWRRQARDSCAPYAITPCHGWTVSTTARTLTTREAVLFEV